MATKFISFFALFLSLSFQSVASENDQLIKHQPQKLERRTERENFFFVFPGDRDFKKTMLPFNTKNRRLL